VCTDIVTVLYFIDLDPVIDADQYRIGIVQSTISNIATDSTPVLRENAFSPSPYSYTRCQSPHFSVCN